MGYNIGIDLGTTNSVCCTMENGKFQIIKLSRKKDILPSVVMYTKEKDIIVGENAKKRAKIKPNNYIKSSKTFMGDNQKVWNIEDKVFTPINVATEILSSINKSAKLHFGTEDTISAVITVPAYFTSKQREETKKAGELAGFNVKSILTEPVAAALAYGFIEDKNQTMLIIDLGGGTFDVTILKLDNKVYKTLAIEGDSKLGGDDFDNIILNILYKHIRKDFGINLLTLESSGLDANIYYQTLQVLNDKAEEIKIELSTFESVDVSIINILNGKTLECTIDRKEFKDESYELLGNIKRTINRCMRDADLDQNEIDKVILVGGSSNIPFVRELVNEILCKEPYSDVDLSKIVAMGAALRSNIDKLEEVGITNESFIIEDITAHSLGIKVVNDGFSIIIPKGTKYPVERTETYTTVYDYQEAINISVYEGESEFATENKPYGGFSLEGIQNDLAGVPEIDVTFNFDESQNLHVLASDKNTKSSKDAIIKISSIDI